MHFLDLSIRFLARDWGAGIYRYLIHLNLTWWWIWRFDRRTFILLSNDLSLCRAVFLGQGWGLIMRYEIHIGQTKDDNVQYQSGISYICLSTFYTRFILKVSMVNYCKWRTCKILENFCNINSQSLQWHPQYHLRQ